MNPHRGQEGVDMLRQFLEKQFGIMSLSINEPNYSTGTQYAPDMVFMNYAIEVKRLEMMSAKRQQKKQDYLTSLNNLKVNSDSWEQLKAFALKRKKIPILIIVLTWGNQEPIFIGFNKNQIESYKEQCKDRDAAQPEHMPESGETYYPHQKTAKEYRGWHFGVNTFQLLKDGITINQKNGFVNFFGQLNHNLKVEIYEKPLHEVPNPYIEA